MAIENKAIVAFNRGRISPLALGRIDLQRYAESAQVQTNFMPRALGSAMLRPGWMFIDDTFDDLQAVHIPFIFSLSDMAIVELTNQTMRVRVGNVAITRPSVTTAITNGTFTTNLNGWTQGDEAGATSQWVAGPFMSLVGNGVSRAIRSQAVALGSGDAGVLHAVRVVVTKGNVILRIGTSLGDSSYVSTTTLPPGTHSLAFTPSGTFYIEVTNATKYSALISSITIEAAGAMTLPTPWLTADLQLIRSDQSADVVYIACNSTTIGGGYPQYMIQRRGTYSWSIVKFLSDDGPFLLTNTDQAIIMTPGAISGDTTLTCSQPYFQPGHLGALFQMTSVGQLVQSNLAGSTQFTNPVEVTGLSANNGRTLTINISGTWVGNITLQYSVGSVGDWVDQGSNWTSNTTNYQFNDGFDNQIIYYRLGFETGNYTSGQATVSIQAGSNGILGIGRVTQVNSNTNVNIEVLQDFGAAEGGSNATGFIQFSANPSNGDTITLNGVTWTFVTSGASGNQTNIQGTLVSTMAQLAHDLTNSTNASLIVAAYAGNANQIVITYGTPGTGGNAYTLAASAGTPSASTLTGGVAPGTPNGTSLWAEGSWSAVQGYPTAVALYEGRLWWAGRDNIFASVSDAYQSNDDTQVGDSGPINASIGSGPVDSINWLVPLLRFAIGGQMQEFFAYSDAIDDPITPTAFVIRSPSTIGSAAVNALKDNLEAIYVQNSGTRVFNVRYDNLYQQYPYTELTIFCPEIGLPSITRLALQKQPDRRVWALRSDGTLACLVYDKIENVQAWIDVESPGGSGIVEDVFVMPSGTTDDYVYFSVNRTMNGVTKRFLEVAAQESQCIGGTLNMNIDSYVTFNNGSPSTTITGLSRFNGMDVVVWADGKDFSPLQVDSNGYPQLGSPTTFAVSGGQITVPTAVTQGVVGLFYDAQYQSVKLAYGAGIGSALTQSKSISYIGLILANTHYQGVLYGRALVSGQMYNMPLVESGTTTPANTVWDQYDNEAIEFDGSWTTDERVCLYAASPRPCTLIAYVASVESSDKA